MSPSTWIFPLSPGAELPRQPDFERLYRRIRNLLRHYTARAVVEACLRISWNEQRQKDKLRQLQACPWHILLIAKWVLQDSGVRLEHPKKDVVPDKLINFIRQSLWTHTGAFNKSKSPRNVVAMLRSYMAVQIQYQRHQQYAFFRWPALIAARPENSILRRQFRELFGLEPTAYMDMVLALKTALMDQPNGVKPDYFALLEGPAGDVVSMRRLFARTLSELRTDLNAPGAKHAKTELLEFPYFVHRPILELDGNFLFWDVVVAEKAFERAVHLRMSSLTGAYSTQFSLVFEKYVVALLREAGLSLMSDADFKKLVGNTKNAEALVPLENANLIVEAKMGLFPDTMVVKDDSRFLYEKFAPLRRALSQGHEVSQTLRKNAATFGKAAHATQDFLIVVTSSELFVSGGPMLKKLSEPHADFDYFDKEVVLPLQNTFIMDIQGFEAFCMVVKEGRINPVQLLKAAAQKNVHVGDGSLFFEQWLEPGQHPKGMPDIIQQAFDQSFQRIEAAFEKNRQ